MLGLSSRQRGWIWPGLLSVFVVGTLLGPSLVPADPDAVDLSRTLRAPSLVHLLGTDQLGRDVLARVVFGGRAALLVGLSATVLSIGLAIVVGGAAGFFGGLLDAGTAMLLDAFLTLPGLLVTLALLGVLGIGSITLVVSLVGVSWATDARVLRSAVGSQRHLGYVLAAEAMGAGPLHIFLRHVMPNASSVVFILASLALGEILLVVAGLSFLGLGAQPPTADWGTMLADGRSVFGQAPWLMLAPGICIVVFSTLAALSGDALRDLTDPSSRSVRSELE